MRTKLMIAKQDVFLTDDRKEAVPAGDPRARVLLARVGQEVPDDKASGIKNAEALLNSEATKEPPKKDAAKDLETRDPSHSHYDAPDDGGYKRVHPRSKRGH